jgi:hypothetical protein
MCGRDNRRKCSWRRRRPSHARQRQRELEKRLVIAERDERLRLEWARQFPEDVAAMEAFYEKKEEEKAAANAAKKVDREERKAKSVARKKEMEKKAARKAEEKKNSVRPSTIVLSPSSSFEWTSTPVSSTAPGSSDFDWDSELFRVVSNKCGCSEVCNIFRIFS